jgi:hypothetical protein
MRMASKVCIPSITSTTQSCASLVYFFLFGISRLPRTQDHVTSRSNFLIGTEHVLRTDACWLGKHFLLRCEELQILSRTGRSP